MTVFLNPTFVYFLKVSGEKWMLGYQKNGNLFQFPSIDLSTYIDCSSDADLFLNVEKWNEFVFYLKCDVYEGAYIALRNRAEVKAGPLFLVLVSIVWFRQ
jgi:hypothetical protein